MALDDTNSIDIILGSKPYAKVTLVIVDGEKHVDDENRFIKLVAKIKCYVAYITSKQFTVDYPGVMPNEVLIGVACIQEPSEKMKLITQVRPRANPDAIIRVRCARYEEGGDLPWFVRPDGEEPT